jgi:lysophospholipase L1-like esterase
VAWTFQDELGAALGARGVPFASAAVVGCGAAVGMTPGHGVVADDNGSPYPWGYTCRTITTQLQQDATAAVHPDLVLFHSTWETADRDLGGRWIRFGTEAWDEQVRSELRDAVDRLAVGGARVALLNAPPIVDGELEQALDRDVERLAHYNELLAEVAADDPERVLLVDFASLVCGGTVEACPTEVDGIRLRPLDGRHFEDEGAAWVGDHLADVVLNLDLNP